VCVTTLKTLKDTSIFKVFQRCALLGFSFVQVSILGVDAFVLLFMKSYCNETWALFTCLVSLELSLILLLASWRERERERACEGERKCEGKYKNIKNGEEKGFCSSNVGRGLTSPKMKRGIESLEGLALCRINQILAKSRF
jgi:hypothetical protein